MPPPVPERVKRKADAVVSPPPLRRKLQSRTTKDVVTSFFTPASQKPKERTVWSERAPNDDVPATLLVGRYEPDGASNELPSKRRKVAIFDLDSTLISTSSGKKHADSASDWKWWDTTVPQRLRTMYQEEDFRIAILSNQGGITLHPDPKAKGSKANSEARVASFKQKCNAVLADLNLPVTLYAATGKDMYRKPRPGMWRELCDDYDLEECNIDLGSSIFVGDAGGRVADAVAAGPGKKKASSIPKDFSCSDRNLAHNIGVKYYTPEEFFLGQKSRPFKRDFDLADHPPPESSRDGRQKTVFEKKNKLDVVMFCGPPGAGKSTFYWKHLKPLGYKRVNQDQLKSRDKCIQAAIAHLKKGESVAIDNTNADPDTRALWVDLAKKHKVPIRCIWFKTPLAVCEHNDAVRSLNKEMNPENRTMLPRIAFVGYSSRFREPTLEEAFQDIVEVDFQFRGSAEEYGIWGRYWT